MRSPQPLHRSVERGSRPAPACFFTMRTPTADPAPLLQRGHSVRERVRADPTLQPASAGVATRLQRPTSHVPAPSMLRGSVLEPLVTPTARCRAAAPHAGQEPLSAGLSSPSPRTANHHTLLHRACIQAAPRFPLPAEQAAAAHHAVTSRRTARQPRHRPGLAAPS